ncbi:alpha-amylase family glycosyl hydrolase [Vitiosangium sp. GDMCC 1.1324]|uniref:alpha-amylase family glycosyl hydrolase n=1 Tax=Vitiosangium sp. (strain GDMCC 1.1324) TaxID=2138576 RepID=UPI000D3434C0|nr:alpha-amylase family glycosyl hydrolase [Vitiosangium sp. GDMCC 1.1324]PTL82924.1 alpha-amylase [Vitiosangium sp. GDMCC 1.1324]
MPRSRPLRLLPLLALSACTSGPATSTPHTTPPVELAAPEGNEWYRHAVFYEVFVRSFQDSNGDGIGDLPGLISRLDYLNDGDPSTTTDLGVDALWLMPVFDSPSYHGYDVVDYERIHPDYGTVEDFERLCAEAHRRGMRVILDLVINHTSSQHPWFVDSASSPGSAKRDWYMWSNTDPGWTPPWDIYSKGSTWHELNGAYYYGVFWGGMPDLNMKTPAVREEVKRIASYWLGKGADGFRLDAARYLIETGGGVQAQADTPETHAFWKEFAAHVRSVKPDAALVGENWTTTPIIATYYGSTAQVPGGDELPLNFNFPLADELLKAAQTGDGNGIALKLAEMRSRYPKGMADAPFLTNHDQIRVATQLSGKQGDLRTAAALLLTLPGSPFVYYGEELGMANGTTNNDEAKRTPMAWDSSAGGGFTTGTPWFSFAPGRESNHVAAQSSNPGSLLSRYRELIRARHASAVLERGGLKLLTSTQGRTPTLAFLRTLGDEQVLVVHNLSDSSATAGPFALEGESAEVLFADSSVGSLERGGGGWSITLPGHATGIWRLR